MPTHFFHSGMSGAPTNTNAAGSTLAIIDAILVTGFNLQSVLSATVASEVMTVNYAAPHLYEDKVLIRLDGAAGGSIVRRATVTGAQVLTIPAPGFADGAVAGTLSTRVAPADWERVFSDTGKAVYRSKATGPGCTRFYYRVSDSVAGGQPEMFRGFVSMTDANTGGEPFPSTAQQSGQGSIVTRANQSSPLPWAAIVDARTVYLFTAYYAYRNLYGHFFGDLTAFSGGDNHYGAVFRYTSIGFALAGDQGTVFTARNYANAPGSVVQSMILGLGSVSGVRTFPSPVDGGLVLQRPVLMEEETSSSNIRGYMRGLMHCGGNPIPADKDWIVLPVVDGVQGRTLVVRDKGNTRCVAFPLDEDWV